MPGLDVFGLAAAAKESLALAALQIEDGDLRRLRRIRRDNREQYPAAFWQHRRVNVIALAASAAGLVNTVGSPPPADTRSSPVAVSCVANTMYPSSPQLAPRGIWLWQIVIGGPPAIDTFFSAGAVEKPDPLTVRREEWVARVGRAFQSMGIEAID